MPGASPAREIPCNQQVRRTACSCGCRLSTHAKGFHTALHIRKRTRVRDSDVPLPHLTKRAPRHDCDPGFLKQVVSDCGGIKPQIGDVGKGIERPTWPHQKPNSHLIERRDDRQAT